MNTQQLITERSLLLEELICFCRDYPEIKSFFLSGSLAKGSDDAYSDIDFRIVISENRLKSDVLTAIKDHFQEQIAFVETEALNYSVLHFKSFIKLDLFAYHVADLKPSIWLRDMLILQDTQQFLAALKSDSQQIDFMVTRDQLVEYLNKYTAYLHESYRRKQRSEWNYCEYSTLMMKQILVSLWLIEAGAVPNSLGDWSKYEGTRSKLSSFQKEWLEQFTPIVWERYDEFIKEINQAVLTAVGNVIEKNAVNLDLAYFDQLFSVVAR